MTTTVKRGAGRPAATEKSNRHAQRTPLPPKPGTVQGAKDAIAEATGPRYGEMTVAELRKVASGLLVKGARSMNKGALLNAILEGEAAEAKLRTQASSKRAEAKVDAALRPTKTEAAIDAAFPLADEEPEAVATQTLGSKSERKAEAYVQAARKLGWAETIAYADGDRITVTTKRGQESIDIEWVAGVFQGDTCFYHHNGRTAIKLRNASAAKHRMAIPPAQADQEAQKVTAHKSVRPKAGKAPSATRSLPFTGASLDQDVLDAICGKEITWTNRISGEPETERVPQAHAGSNLKRQPRITEGPDGRVIHFVGAAGFKSVLLSQITRVR
jgi:hypothetical protein